MSDDLYQQDILAWSTRQSDLLRRLARGERVNGVDWSHVVEEIEDVGLAQLHAVRSFLRQMLVHLLKLHAWPESDAAGHWRGEVALFQAEAAQRFAPSMRRRIAVDRLFAEARTQLEGMTHDGRPPLALPAACPFTLDALLQGKRAELEDRLRDAARPA
ncbi:MAG: DUF29 domain-containing protein [Acetobacteraceae bacterium]